MRRDEQTILQQIRAVSYGQVSDLDDIIVVSKYFSDETIVDYLDKAQLTSIAKYMNVMTIGGDELTRVGLRTAVAAFGNAEPVNTSTSGFASCFWMISVLSACSMA